MIRPSPLGSMLYLNDDDYFSGTLRDCTTPNTLRWQARGRPSRSNLAPTQFAPLTLPRPKTAAPEGEYSLELSEATCCSAPWPRSQGRFEIDSAQFGHLKIARAESIGSSRWRPPRLPTAARTIWPSGHPTTSANGAKKPAGWSPASAALDPKVDGHPRAGPF